MIPSGPQGEHLYTVALGPSQFEHHGTAEHVVLVSFTSIKDGMPYDTACEVAPGEHPFIVKPSYIFYREPKPYRVADVQQRVSEGVWRPQQPCSAELLQRVISGFRLSKRLPRTYNSYLDQLGY